MNPEILLKEISKEVKKNINLAQVNEMLKSGSDFENEQAEKMIEVFISEIGNKKIENMSPEEIAKCANFLQSTKVQNLKNAMKSTFNEEGLVYADAMVDLKICEFLASKAPKKEKPAPVAKKPKKKGFFARIFQHKEKDEDKTL